MITKQDEELVRDLAEKHLGHHRYPAGMRPEDVETNTSLLRRTEVVTNELNRRKTLEFLASHGILTSEYYLEKFRGEAIFAKMAEELGNGPVVTIGVVAQRIADEIECARTGKKPEPPRITGEQKKPKVIISSLTKGRGNRGGCGFMLVVNK